MLDLMMQLNNINKESTEVWDKFLEEIKEKGGEDNGDNN